MAETKVVMPNGTEITVSGTAEEVASVIARLTGIGTPAPDQPRATETRKKGSASASGIRSRILAVRGDGFFNEARTLREIQSALKEKGYIYPVTSISPTVLGLVRKGDLRRMKSKTGKWTYVRP